MTTAAPKVRLKVLAVDAKMLGTTPALVVIAVSGARYQLRHAFASLEAAERAANRVAQKGSIDPMLWDVVGLTKGSPAERYLEASAQAEAKRLEAAREAKLAA
jgi:hypothetical protein